jgi:predicted nucleotidyltransferase
MKSSDTHTRTGLKPWMLDAIRETIASDARVERVVLFGSRAKGSYREGSDIDLAVFGEGVTHSDASGWADELEERLFPWSVDVVAVGPGTNEDLRAHIERVGIPL